MSNFRSVAVIIVIAPLFVLGCAKEPAESPRAAWVESVAAFQNGQPERLKKVMVMKNEQAAQAVLESVGLIGDLGRLRDAAGTKWGAKAAVFTKMRDQMASQFSAKAQPTGDASIDGDSATLMLSNGTTLPFRRVHGGWKIDFDQVGTIDSKSAAQTLAAAQQARECIQRVTTGVNNGHHDTIDTASEALISCMKTFGEAASKID